MKTSNDKKFQQLNRRLNSGINMLERLEEFPRLQDDILTVNLRKFESRMVLD